MIIGKKEKEEEMKDKGKKIKEKKKRKKEKKERKEEKNDKTAKVSREVDGGTENIEITLPAIITTDLRLNEPRYASLPNIMKAKKKPLDTSTPEELGVDVTPRVTQVGVELPAERSAGIKVDDVAQLVDKLKNEAKVIS